MTDLTQFLEPLGWAVLHSLWQGALILLLVLGMRRLAGPNRPHLAYLAGTVGLGLSFLAFLVTLAWFAGRAEPVTLALTGAPSPSNTPVPAIVADGAAAGGLTFGWRDGLPWLGALWGIGFVVLSLQCMYAWARTRCYATLGLSAPEGDWESRFADLVQRAGARSTIVLKVSALVDSPVTLGTFKPLVLVPAGFLTGFPPAQVEAILLHEIAHIRRHDFLIGLLQTAIRTTLYFNPAVVILSRLVDEDREQACDDFAVRHAGGAKDLARGLAALRLSLMPKPLMAATGSGRTGPLVVRLERLMGRPVEVRGLDRLTAAGVAAALTTAALFAPDSWAHPHPPTAPDSFTLDDEVILSEMPAAPVAPEFPAIPPITVIPSNAPTPPMPKIWNGESEASFESRMEDWAEQMEEWGESFGEAMEEQFEGEFEERMEAWGKNMEAWGSRMEAWGQSVEQDGEHINALNDMSDAELKALGMTRDDVELLAEDFGLDVAESVVSAMFGRAMDAETRAEFDAKRAELDQDRIEAIKARVETSAKQHSKAHAKAQAEREKAFAKARIERDKAQAERNKAQALRDKAQAERNKAQAERDKTYAERDKRYAERDKRYAERDRRRAEERAERERERAEARARDKHEKSWVAKPPKPEDAFDAKAVSETLMTMLRQDGLIERDAERYVFKSYPDWTKVDGKRRSDAQHERYRAYLLSQKMDDDARIWIERKPGKIELEMRSHGNTTRVTMTE